ncbi:MAG: hypothetical protein AAGF26_01750 [Cyanobacteria bacterium P01_G01_bin.49]
MKIVMVGHTNVGKTTYMASLYGVMQQSINDFCLKAVDSEDRQALLKLADDIQKGKYPLPTDQRSEYKFNLRYQGKDVFPFTWADYRGGAIIQKQDSEQAQLLLEDLKKTDGIMMFCDADALARGNIRSNQLGRMTTLISQALRELENPISLSIILTKVDLVPKFTKNMLSPFSGIIKAIEVSDLVLGALIPVACGHQLINIPLPLLFTLSSGVVIKRASLEKLSKDHYSSALNWEEKSKGFSGLVRWVQDTWNGVTTDEEMARREREKAIQTRQEYESILEPAKALVSYINKLPIIQKGMDTVDYLNKINSCQNTEFSLQSTKTGSFYQTYTDPFDAFN